MKITKAMIRPLALGMELLGSGGGGSATYQTLLLDFLLNKQMHPLHIIPPETVAVDAFILPVAYIGAPIVCLEQLQDGSEFKTLMATAKQVYGRSPDYLMSAEIGGSNGLTALIGSCITGIPVVDADLIGRAFPCLQMASAHLAGIPIGPAIICDAQGNSTAIFSKEALSVENIARNISIAFGSNGLMSLYPLSGKTILHGAIGESITRAHSLGNAIIDAQKNAHPLKTLSQAIPAMQIVCQGIITDVEVHVADGFTRGTIHVTTQKQGTLTIVYQNEYLQVLDQHKTSCAATPDIITLLDSTNLKPILSDEIQFGMQVAIITLPAPDCWYTSQGMALVGPETLLNNG